MSATKAKKSPDPGEAGRHLGLRLSAEVGQLLKSLVADEQSRAGVYASVSASSFVVGLIVAEAQRRGMADGKPTRTPPELERRLEVPPKRGRS